MAEKKLAVFITEWDPHFWSRILKGVRNRAKLDDYDVFVFDCFGGAGTKRKHDIGEFRIFDLPDLTKFDGAIVAASTIIPTSVVKSLANKIVERGCPAISLEVPIEGLDFGGISNHDSIIMIMDHVIVHHKCERIYFVTGPEGNAEASMRKNAYIEAMQKAGLEVRDEYIFTGTYEFESGYRAVDYYNTLPDGLPQAIVCANDAMAMGVCRRLDELGVEVPEQVIVTGFDNIETANDYVPSLTTVARPKKELGALACDYIIRKIENPEINTGLQCKTKLEHRESCGCQSANLYVGRKFRLQHFRQIEEEANLSRFMNRMMARVTDCDWFSELFICLQDFVDMLECERFYFCIDQSLIDDSCVVATDVSDMSVINEHLRGTIESFPERVSVAVACNKGEAFKCKDYDGNERILPVEEDQFKSSSDLYIYEPVHYQDNIFGYCVMVNPTPGQRILGVNKWLLMVGNAIETIRRKHVMNMAIKQLDQLYTTDPLTGLYNRFGFERYSSDMLDACTKDKKPLVAVFFDLDGLKLINDEFGHEIGDIAIKTVAEALKEVSDDQDVIVRLGGDEFLALCSRDNETIETKIKRVDEVLEKKNKELDLPFYVSASGGYRSVIPDENTDIDELIEEADQAMYEVKKKKKETISLQNNKNSIS